MQAGQRISTRARLAELTEAGRVRCRIAALLPRAGFVLVSGLALCNVVLGALPVVFIVASSVFLGRIPAAVAAGSGSAAWDALVGACVVAAAAFVVQQLLSPFREALAVLVARRVDGTVFRQLMTAAMRAPGITALEDQRTLKWLRLASHELVYPQQSPGSACAGLLAVLARYVQLLGCVGIVAHFAPWPVAAAVMAAVLVLRQAERGGLRRYSKIYLELDRPLSESRYLRQLGTGAEAAKELRVFGLVPWLRDRYRASYLAWLLPVWAERRWIYRRPYLMAAAVSLVLFAVALVALDVSAAQGAMTLTGLVMTLQAGVAALRLADFYPDADLQTQLGMFSYSAVREFEQGVARLDAAPALGTTDQPPAPRNEIRFDNVGFRYPGQARPVLDGLDLSIPVGRTIAIVGANGAGKTTLVKLLTRLYEPTSGTLRMDDVDSRTVPHDVWRARIAVVFQDFLRYGEPAGDNIGFGRVERLGDDAGIRAAARAAGVAGTLDRLAAGFHTPLAADLDGGTDLSGGQWQRVALARALFAVHHGASVLVLDEPTASLDVRAEARFFGELADVTRDLTTVLISHRFSTVRHADRIVVLSDGRIIEQGTHDELLDLGGRYSEMFRLQARRFVDDDAALARETG